MSSLYMGILKMVVQAFFLLQSLILIIPASLYRLAMRLVSNKKLHFNPLRHTHEDVFKSNCNLGDLLSRAHKTVGIQDCLVWMLDWGSGFRELLEDCTRWEINKITVKETGPHSAWAAGLLHVMVPASGYVSVGLFSRTCLPYALAGAGYDVWIGNNRGTKYSSKNSHLK